MTPTGADEHDVVLAVLGLHAVDHDLLQPVLHIGLDQNGLSLNRVDGPPHQGVTATKLQHRVREVLGAGEIPTRLVDYLTGTLRGKGRDMEKVSNTPLIEILYVSMRKGCFTGACSETRVQNQQKIKPALHEL